MVVENNIRPTDNAGAHLQSCSVHPELISAMNTPGMKSEFCGKGGAASSDWLPHLSFNDATAQSGVQKDIKLSPQEQEALQKAIDKNAKHLPDGSTVLAFGEGSSMTVNQKGELVEQKNADGSGFSKLADGSIHHWGKKPEDNWDEVRKGDKSTRTYANGTIEETDLRDGSIVVTLPKRGHEGTPDKIYISANGDSQYMTDQFFRQLTDHDFGKVKHYGSPQEALEAARKQREFPEKAAPKEAASDSHPKRPWQSDPKWNDDPRWKEPKWYVPPTRNNTV